MKRLYSLLFTGLLCAALAAGIPVRGAEGVPVDQYHFPDPVFRQWLLDAANIGGAGADGVLTSEELLAVTEIRVPAKGIASLQGIEFFPELVTLTCGNNLLTSLDVSRNPKLKTLLCDVNRLTELDLSHNPALTALNCETNRLTRLDLTGCTELDWLYCRHNQLSQLDLSTHTSLTCIETFDNQLTSIDVSSLTRLKFLHIDENQLTELDLSHNTALVNDGSGFVVRDNYIRKLILPDHENLTVDPDVYARQKSREGYATTEWYLDPDFTLPVTGPIQAEGQTLYVKWIPNPYTIYLDLNGGTGSVTSIATVYDAQVVLPGEEVRREGYTLQGWLGYVGGKNQLYAPGATVSNLTGKWDYQTKITLQAQWARTTTTRLELVRDSYPYTGQPVALEALTEVLCGGVPAVGAAVEYHYYSAAQPDTPLPQAPTAAGSYLVQAVFPGNSALEQLESASGLLPFTITRSTAALSFDGPQELLWTGETAAIRPAVLTLNGLPWQGEVAYSYRADDSAPWSEGLPAAPGIYQLRAELNETEDHSGALAETTLRIVCFQKADGVVAGALPVEVPAGTGDCRILVALYDRDSGQQLDVILQTRSRGGTAVLRELRLDPRGRENLLVKVFVLGEALEGLTPAPDSYEL